MSANKIVVLGSRGFIGSNLFRGLKQLYPLEQVIGLSSNECNLMDLESTNTALASIAEGSIIVMVSAKLREPSEPYSNYEYNKIMAENLVKTLTQTTAKSLIFLSSVDVYGRPPLDSLITEVSRPNPTGHYGLSKLLTEYLFRLNFKFPTTIFRLPGVYGASDNATSIVGQLLRKLYERSEISLSNGGAALRDYIHVSDVVKYCAQAIKNPNNSTYNLVSGEVKSIQEVLKICESVTGITAKVKSIKADNPEYNLIFDTTKLRKDFDSTKCRPLQLGIEQVARLIKDKTYVDIV